MLIIISCSKVLFIVHHFPDRLSKAVRLQRFVDKLANARNLNSFRSSRFAVAGTENHRNIGANALHLLSKLNAGHLRHGLVRNHQVKPIRL